MKILKRQKATTLIEILLYFTLLTVFIGAAMSFSLQIANIYGLTSNIGDVQNNGNFFEEQVTYKIQTALSVDSAQSIFDNDAGKLVLNMSDAAKSPTSFYYQNGDIFIQEGLNSAVKLNNTGITYNFLRFTRITNSKSPDLILINAELTSTGDIASSQHIETLDLAINLRQ